MVRNDYKSQHILYVRCLNPILFGWFLEGRSSQVRQVRSTKLQWKSFSNACRDVHVFIDFQDGMGLVVILMVISW